MNENKQNLNTPPWWKLGVEIFSQISVWIVIPIILALIAGKALDSHFQTAPVMLLVLAGVSFLISSYGIVTTVRKYAQKMK